MVYSVLEEGDAITCCQIFHIRLKEIPPGNSTERSYSAITVYIIAIGFPDPFLLIPRKNALQTTGMDSHQNSKALCLALLDAIK